MIVRLASLGSASRRSFAETGSARGIHGAIERAIPTHSYFHRLTKNQRMWLKVGTVRHRSSWYVRGDPPIGMNLGNDASEINLDITLEKYQTAKVFLTKVFDDIATEVGVARRELLTDGAVDRLVLASGGVARDFLSIANTAIGVARERGKTYRGVEVNVEDVNQACGEHEGTKRDELSDAVGGDDTALLEQFERIRGFCINAQANCFLIEKDLRVEAYEQVQQLVDLRLLHLVKSRVTVRERPGKLYEAYLLDLSQYTGSRKMRAMKILEFWKTGRQDELRRARLIYDLGDDTRRRSKAQGGPNDTDKKRRKTAKARWSFGR